MSYIFNPFIGNLDNTGAPSNLYSESFEIESDGSFYDFSFINLRPIRSEVPLSHFYNYGTYTFTNLITSEYTSFEGSIILNSELKNPTTYFNIKNIEYFNGNITVTSHGSLTSLTFPNLKACTGTITITNNNALSTLEVNELEFVNNLTLGGYAPGFINTELQKISFPKLKFVAGNLNIDGSRVTAGHQAVLSELNFPALEQIGSTGPGGFTLGSVNFGNTTYPLLTSVTFPNLRMANVITLRRCPSLSAISFPNLKRVNEFVLNESTPLRDVNLPELTIIGGYFFSTAAYPNLTALDLPKLELITHGGQLTFSMSQLSNLNLGNNILRQVALATFTFTTSLNQTSVDNILKTIAGLDGTGVTDLYGTGKILSLGGSNSAPSYTGGVTTSSAGTNFVRTGTTVVAQVDDHGHTNGDIVTFTGNSQNALNGTYVVTVITDDQFEYTTLTSGNTTGGGTVTMRRTTVATDGFKYFQTIALRGATVTITNP